MTSAPISGSSSGCGLRPCLSARWPPTSTPRMVALHNLSEGDEYGTHDENGAVMMPPMLNLTSESMTQDGVYLLENGEEILMWIGRAVSPNWLQAVFGIPAIEQLDVTTAEQS